MGTREVLPPQPPPRQVGIPRLQPWGGRQGEVAEDNGVARGVEHQTGTEMAPQPQHSVVIHAGGVLRVPPRKRSAGASPFRAGVKRVNVVSGVLSGVLWNWSVLLLDVLTHYRDRCAAD